MQQGNQPEQIMMMARRTQQCLVPLTHEMKKALTGLFLLLQHPYLQVLYRQLCGTPCACLAPLSIVVKLH